MSSAGNVDSLLASLPQNVQDAIKQMVAQELAKNAPEPPKELTEAEQAAQHVALARSALQNDLNMANFNGRVLATLEMLIDKVYPAEDETAPVATPVAASETTGAI